MNKKLHGIRNDYDKGKLNKSDAPADPFLLFGDWLELALHQKVSEPSAMVLSTATLLGRPSSRIVLLKYYDTNGFIFFTNYESKKGNELMENPYASLLFFWPELECQIRIEGKVDKTENEISDHYFNSRPMGSRISASVSPQSREVPSKEFLENLHKEKQKEIEHYEFIRPEFWGGYRLIPDYFEFWKGRKNRLHDRIAYKQTGDAWIKLRLAP